MYKKKVVLGFSRFASMLFLNIWKGDEQKIVRAILRFACILLKIFKKKYKWKIVLGIFRFGSMFFLNIWKGDKQKIVQAILRYASILF